MHKKAVKNLKAKTSSLRNHKHFNKAAVFVAVFALIGAYSIIRSLAATPTAQFEAESSSLAGCATPVADTNASGGSAVQFGCTTSRALIVAGSTTLNTSESNLRTRLQNMGYIVTIVTDTNVTTTQANSHNLVVMSKTVLSTNVGTKLKQSTSPVIFWEDNQQQLSMMATIDSSNTTGTGWHAAGTQINVNGSVTSAMRAGLSGTQNFLDRTGEITYAPKSNSGAQTLISGATRIAQYGSTGDGRWAVYAIDTGTTLADGSSARGKRVYFGLYDDTFRNLTTQGLSLFEALVKWADPSVTTPVSTTCTGGIRISAGQSIQNAINANPDGTTFCLDAGTYSGQSLSPKQGNRFIGTTGTILDGQGTTAIAFRPTADNVTIAGMTIQNYVPTFQIGAVHGGGHNIENARTGWVVENNTIQNNNGTGLRIGSNMIVRNNKIIRNVQLGVGGVGNDTLIEGNEIAYNNPDNVHDPGNEAGGTKFVKTNRLIVRGNYVHHNVGPGLWTDINNVNTIYENNTVEDNTQMGIFHEISFDVIIRNNKVNRNGFGQQQWGYGAGILIAHSPNATVHDNTLNGNWNGLMGIQQLRTDSPSSLGDHSLKNLNAYNNIITITTSSNRDSSSNGAWVAGLLTDYGEMRIYGEWNNKFTGNTYIVPRTDSWWTFNNSRRSWDQWKANGMDATGTLTTSP